MRSLFFRQLWMPCALASLAAMMILFMVVDRREHTVGVEMPRRGDGWLEGDALPLFYEAYDLLNTQTLDAHSEYHLPLGGRVGPVSLGAPYPPEQREALRAYVDRHTEAINLTKHIAQCRRFDSPLSLWQSVELSPRLSPHPARWSVSVKRVRPIDGIMYSFRPSASVYRFSETRHTYAVLRLLNCVILDAILKGDVDGFFVHFERVLRITALLMDPGTLPGPLTQNLNGAFLALDMLEEAANRLVLDDDRVAALRRVIAETLYDREEVFTRAFENHLTDCMGMLWKAKELSAIPTTMRDHYGYRNRHIFDRPFLELQDSWLSPMPLERAYFLHSMRNIVRLGAYQRYGGAESLILTPDAPREAENLYKFLRYTGAGRMIPRFNVFSRKRAALFQDEVRLSPYHADFEPYLALLAYARAADTSLAVMLFHRTQGRPPETLDELTGRHMEKIPQDPYLFDTPLRFHRDEKRFIVYSVGPNQRDDQGQSYPKMTTDLERMHPKNAADIVFSTPLMSESQGNTP